jgi:hypothetical protein
MNSLPAARFTALPLSLQKAADDPFRRAVAAGSKAVESGEWFVAGGKQRQQQETEQGQEQSLTSGIRPEGTTRRPSPEEITGRFPTRQTAEREHQEYVPQVTASGTPHTKEESKAKTRTKATARAKALALCISEYFIAESLTPRRICLFKTGFGEVR